MKKRTLFKELMLGAREMVVQRRAESASGCSRDLKDLDLDPAMSVIAPCHSLGAQLFYSAIFHA